MNDFILGSQELFQISDIILLKTAYSLPGNISLYLRVIFASLIFVAL